MSRADTRAEIAAALSTVAGVHGYATRPDTPNQGDAWPQWRGSEYAGGRSYTDKWVVLVVLPSSDDVSADRYADRRADAIIEALQPIMFVDSVDPAEIPALGQQNAIRALAFTGRE